MTATVTLADGGVLDVGRWPLPEGLADGIVNRAQLAIAFGVSENTITKWVTQGLPVSSAGANGVSYEFKLSHCWAWKQNRDHETRAVKQRGDQLAAQAAMAFRNLGDDGTEEESELTAADVRAWSEAEYHRNRVAEQRGTLLRAERVQGLIEDMLVAFRTSLTTLPDYAEIEFGLTAVQVQQLQGRCDEILGAARAEMEKVLGRGASIVSMRGDDAAPQGQLAL